MQKEGLLTHRYSVFIITTTVRIKQMNQISIREILEALRGKTIIDKITLRYESPVPEELFN